MRRMLLTSLLLAGLVVGFSTKADAAPLVYSCPASNAECLGQTFALWIDGQVGDTYTIGFSINTTGYSGPTPAYAHAISFKAVFDGAQANDIDAVSMVDAPGGAANWTAILGELNNGGGDPDCEFGNTGVDRVCAQATNALNGGDGFAFSIGDILTWKISVTIDGDTDLEALGHIKYAYVNADGRKIAGFLSEDITLQDCPGGVCGSDGDGDGGGDNQSPEPATMALFGLGLAMAASRLRKRN